MTASKRYVPVSLVCLLIASTYTATTNPAKAGGSSLDPYAHVQAPTAKELEDKNNKARAKKGLPPIHKGQATSSTKVEDISSTTTYVTAPGGGNGKAIKQNSAVAESGTGGGKLFGKFPKIGLPSMPSLPVLGKGKAKAKSEQETEVAEAKAKKEKGPKIAANKTETKVAKETPVGEEVETASTASTSSVAKASGAEGEGNVVAKTLKATTNGMVNGSKKVGSGIASGAKASGNVIAKGASMVGSGFKATGEKIKGGTGKIATMGMPHIPNPFHKKNKGGSTAVTLATSPAVAGGEPSLGSPRRPGAANSQNELLKQSKASAIPSKSTHLPETDELVSEQSIAAGNTGAKGGLAGMSEKMNSTFSKLNPFSKKGIAGKKQKQTL